MIDLLNLPLGFRERINVDARGCWLWTGALTEKGYAYLPASWGYPSRRGHRATFEMANGAIPDGLEPDHTCRVRRCINPAHLEAVTRTVNTLRGDGPEILRTRHAARTHCKRGHPFDESNTYLMPGEFTTAGQTKPARACKHCRHDATRRYRQKGTRHDA